LMETPQLYKNLSGLGSFIFWKITIQI
jgi:hypothetical protein